jgi:hypothetical protein
MATDPPGIVVEIVRTEMGNQGCSCEEHTAAPIKINQNFYSYADLVHFDEKKIQYAEMGF